LRPKSAVLSGLVVEDGLVAVALTVPPAGEVQPIVVLLVCFVDKVV
jgi:hypothetical protein